MLLRRRLIVETEGDLVVEWELQDGIVLATHEHEEDGHVGATCVAIAVEIEANSHLVAGGRREERGRVDRRLSLGLSVTYGDRERKSRIIGSLHNCESKNLSQWMSDGREGSIRKSQDLRLVYLASP